MPIQLPAPSTSGAPDRSQQTWNRGEKTGPNPSTPPSPYVGSARRCPRDEQQDADPSHRAPCFLNFHPRAKLAAKRLNLVLKPIMRALCLQMVCTDISIAYDGSKPPNSPALLSCGALPAGFKAY